jgi:C-terminal processing protease CtpA/Prc
MINAMKPWLLLAAIFAISPLFAADKAEHPTAEFLALPQAQRNLAVYDAFWDALEANYFDPGLVTTPEMRELRQQLREYAESENRAANLYKRILGEVAAQLPASHVGAEPPVRPEKAPKPETGKYSADLEQKLVTLLSLGPGYSGADVRRGSRTYGLVTEVMPDTPAEVAGIRPGWRVVRAGSDLKPEDQAVRFTGEFVPLDARQATAWERGELKPTVADQWKIVRISFDHRAIKARPPIESRDLGQGISYLRFDTFGDESFMDPVLDALAKAGAGGLIIDLRWNVGGVANQLQRVAGALLADGATLGTMLNAKGSEVMAVTRPAQRYDGPLVLLVGPGTGSGAEMLAAAVHDHQRGRLVGRMTNGSALVSEAFPLPDGGFARVPISDFITTTGKRIEGVGVTPDIRVMPTLEDVRAGRDVTLERAVNLLRETSASN